MASLNINDYWVVKSQVDTLADLEAGIEQSAVQDINRADAGTSTSFITIQNVAPASAKNGEAWVDTSGTGAARPSILTRLYNSSEGKWDGLPWSYESVPPDGSALQTGRVFYDQTRHGAVRIYHTAAHDASIGMTGLAGWHTVSRAYALLYNRAGAAVSKGDVVVYDNTDAHSFTLPSATKDASVVGVIMGAAGSASPTVTDDALAIVATVQGGAVVDVNVDETTYTVTAGDYLVCNAASSRFARSVGAVPTTPILAAGAHAYGVPYGAFAVALETPATGSTGACKARLLGTVGGGRTLLFPEHEIASGGDTGFEHSDFGTAVDTYGSWIRWDLTAPPSGSSIFTASQASAQHGPILAVMVHVEMWWTAANDPTGNGAFMRFSTNDSAVSAKIGQYANEGIAGTSIISGRATIPTSLDATTGATSLGNGLSWSGWKHAGSGTLTLQAASNVDALGYIY